MAFISIALISGFPVPEKTFVNEITAVFHSLRQVTAASLVGAEFPVSVSVQMPEQQQQVLDLLLEKVERITAHVTFTQSVRLVSLLSYLILACYSAHTRIIEIWLYNCSQKSSILRFFRGESSVVIPLLPISMGTAVLRK